MHEFWKRLRADEARWKALGAVPLTVQQVADALGVDRSTVYYWERKDGKQPSDDILGSVFALYRATNDEQLEFLRLKSPPRAAEPIPAEPLPPEFGDDANRPGDAADPEPARAAS